MKFITVTLILVALIGCQQKESTDIKTAGKQHSSTMFSAPPSADSVPVANASLTGTVLEAINVTGYTYLRLKTSQGEIWTAVEQANVKKGTEVTVFNAALMKGFESKTLGRKFDQIFFGSLSRGSESGADKGQVEAGQMKPAHKQEMIAKMHPGVTNPQMDIGIIKVKKAEGAEGKTIAEIFAARSSLQGALVAVRGKVVKYNAGILGKNWLHLRDGSGSLNKQDFDLTVTTRDIAATGDTVVIKGKVALDRDFGAGYTYRLIIEEARVSK